MKSLKLEIISKISPKNGLGTLRQTLMEAYREIYAYTNTEIIHIKYAHS